MRRSSSLALLVVVLLFIHETRDVFGLPQRQGRSVNGRSRPSLQRSGGSRRCNRDVKRNCNLLVGKTPDEEDYWCELENMVDFGPRITGSSNHSDYLDYVQDELERVGLQSESYDMTFDRWISDEFSLVIDDETIDVGFPLVRSKLTEEEGITHPLRMMTDPTVDESPYIGVTKGTFNTNGVSGCNLSYVDLSDNVTVYRPVNIVEAESNVKGMVCCVTYNQTLMPTIDGQYMNFDSTTVGKNEPHRYEDGIPVFVVDDNDGQCKGVYAAAERGEEATLKLTGTYEEATTRDVFTILPGRIKDKYIFLGVHTDGVSAVEENAIAAKLMMAKYFANAVERQGKEFEYSLVFVGLTSHFDSFPLPDGEIMGFCRRYPGIMANVTVAINLEHFGVPQGGTGSYYTNSALGPGRFGVDLYNYWASNEALDILFDNTAVKDNFSNFTIEHGDAPPAYGEADDFAFSGTESCPCLGYTGDTIGGVIYPSFYTNLETGHIGRLNSTYYYEQADSVRKITEKLLNGFEY